MNDGRTKIDNDLPITVINTETLTRCQLARALQALLGLSSKSGHLTLHKDEWCASMGTASLRVQFFPVLFASISNRNRHRFFSSPTSSGSHSSFVRPVTIHGLIDWDAVDSNYSSEQAQAFEIGVVFQTAAGRTRGCLLGGTL